MGITLKAWLLRIVAAALLGGIADALTRNSRQNGIVRMAAALATLAVVMSPLAKLDPAAFFACWTREGSIGEAAAASGQALQVSLTHDATAAGFADWIESRAAAYGVACTATVTLDDELCPEQVILMASEETLQDMDALCRSVAAELGIRPEQIGVKMIEKPD